MPTVSAVDPAFDELVYHVAPAASSQGMEPEVVLWVEFLGQMLQDATIEDAKIEKALKRQHLDGADSPVLIRQEARSFLFAEYGATASWYTTICLMAELDPDFVRSLARRAIKTGRRIRKDTFAQAVRAPDANLPDEPTS